MNRTVFMTVLRSALSGLPDEEVVERLAFYDEAIDDRMEEGLTEEEAVADLGPINKIVSQALADVPLIKIVKEKVTPKRSRSALEIVLLVLGSPIWLSLLIALFAIVISIYAVFFSLVISLWAIELSVAASSLCGFVLAPIRFAQGHMLPGLAMISIGLVCAGLAILLPFVIKPLSRGFLKLGKRIVIWIKSLFVGKEKQQ